MNTRIALATALACGLVTVVGCSHDNQAPRDPASTTSASYGITTTTSAPHERSIPGPTNDWRTDSDDPMPMTQDNTGVMLAPPARATDIAPPVSDTTTDLGAAPAADDFKNGTRPLRNRMQNGASGSTGNGSMDTTTVPPPMPATTPTTGAADQGPAVAPDNTKKNERDRHGAALTPMNQGNAKDELKITATIRKQLVADKTLGFNAKNIKVITQGSKVTLRGPVKTDQEKATIEGIARQQQGVTDVDNQIEVKP